ncbi:hypothetical protein FAVG1_06055 [Fusarium avenaceum]|nr:hypothetical protein FAVG1_06055 [Fusarium avenaceum]
MKSAYALTLCLSGMMGADAWVLPAGAAPKSNYALQRPDNGRGGNQNAAGTGVKFSPNQGSSAAKSDTVPGFIPVKGLAGGPSKRHALYIREAQPDDDGDDDASDGDASDKDDGDDDSGDEEAPQMTAFSRPAFRIGTLKQADSGDDTKTFKVNNKKQKGKTEDKKKTDDNKTKHSGDDDGTKTTKTAKSKTSSTAVPTKSKHSGDDEKKPDDNKTKHSGDDDGTKTTKVHKTKTSATSVPTKTKHSGSDDKKSDDKKTSTKSKASEPSHKSHTSKHS